MKFDNLKVKDICDFIGGSQPPKSEFSSVYKDGYVRLIQTRDYKTNNYITYIPENSTTKFCDEKDIMVGRYGPPIFQICRGLKGAYNVALMKAKPKQHIDNDFLYYFLCTKQLLTYVEKLSARTGGQTGVDLVALDEYPVRVPIGKENQQKFVRILVLLDEKIKLNESIYSNNLNLAKIIYSYYYEQFEIENSNRFSVNRSDQSMIYREEIKQEIPVEWEIFTLHEMLEISKNKFLEKNFEYINYLDTSNLTSNIIGNYQKLYCKTDNVSIN